MELFLVYLISSELQLLDWWSSVAFLAPCPLVKLTLSSILDLEKLSQTLTLYFQGACCVRIVSYFPHFWHQVQSWAGCKIKCGNLSLWNNNQGNLPPVALVTVLRQGTPSVTLMPLKTSMMFTAGMWMVSVSFLKLDLVKKHLVMRGSRRWQKTIFLPNHPIWSGRSIANNWYLQELTLLPARG